ncbi:hypothetical protein B0H14DRAFT_3472620 [Mycena olivaceomarginata]|nr:hypothetical protein B0H14DRAFT_3472620 [Mycena olivaceomarginata]
MRLRKTREKWEISQRTLRNFNERYDPLAPAPFAKTRPDLCLLAFAVAAKAQSLASDSAGIKQRRPKQRPRQATPPASAQHQAATRPLTQIQRLSPALETPAAKSSLVYIPAYTLGAFPSNLSFFLSSVPAHLQPISTRTRLSTPGSSCEETRRDETKGRRGENVLLHHPPVTPGSSLVPCRFDEPRVRPAHRLRPRQLKEKISRTREGSERTHVPFPATRAQSQSRVASHPQGRIPLLHARRNQKSGTYTDSPSHLQSPSSHSRPMHIPRHLHLHTSPSFHLISSHLHPTPPFLSSPILLVPHPIPFHPQRWRVNAFLPSWPSTASWVEASARIAAHSRRRVGARRTRCVEARRVKGQGDSHDSKKVWGPARRIDPVRIRAKPKRCDGNSSNTGAPRLCAPRVCPAAHTAQQTCITPSAGVCTTQWGAADVFRHEAQGLATSGYMSRGPPAHDNPVARKEGEVGARAGHPARARSGRLIYGRERRNTGYPVEKKPEEEKDRGLERAHRASSESTAPHY